MSDELEPSRRAILRACEEADALPADVRARVWQRIERDVATRPVAGGRTWAVAALALAAATAAVWFGGDALLPSVRVAESSAPYAHEEGAPTLLEPPLLEHGTPTAAPPAITPAELPATARPVPVDPSPSASAEPGLARRGDAAHGSPLHSSEPAASSPVIPDFADELARLRLAQGALRTDPQRTLAVLDGLDRDHPGGALAPERAALRIFALCAAGDAAAARSHAAVFATRHPASPLSARVRSACAHGETPAP